MSKLTLSHTRKVLIACRNNILHILFLRMIQMQIIYDIFKFKISIFFRICIFFLFFFKKELLRIIKIPNQEKHFNLKQNQNKEFLGVFFFQIFILIGMIRPYIEGPNISKKSYLFFKVLPPSFEFGHQSQIALKSMLAFGFRGV